MIGGYNQVLVTIGAELEVAATPPTPTPPEMATLLAMATLGPINNGFFYSTFR